MSRDELERLGARGEEVARFLACDAVGETIQDELARRREAILGLKSSQAEEFGRLKAGLEALEELVAALESYAESGRQARESLRRDADTTNAGRVL